MSFPTKTGSGCVEREKSEGRPVICKSVGEEKDSDSSSSEEEVDMLCAGPAKTKRESGLPFL